MANPIVDQLLAHDGCQNNRCTVVKFQVVDLLVAAEPLGRHPLGDQLIDAPAKLIKLFVLAPNYQAIPVAPVSFGA